jgi:alpha-ketoglutarate-dependent 2,4-dichlorophenoxyacetate dioxygenase
VLVRTIPQNRRKSLYHASHAVRVVGMPHEESEKLLNELMEHNSSTRTAGACTTSSCGTTAAPCTSGTEYDERRWKRDMHRATVSDIGNTCEA